MRLNGIWPIGFELVSLAETKNANVRLNVPICFWANDLSTQQIFRIHNFHFYRFLNRFPSNNSGSNDIRQRWQWRLWRLFFVREKIVSISKLIRCCRNCLAHDLARMLACCIYLSSISQSSRVLYNLSFNRCTRNQLAHGSMHDESKQRRTEKTKTDKSVKCCRLK